MHDPALVRRLQPFGNLSRDRQGLVDGNWTFSQAIGECDAVDELQDERTQPVGLLEAVNAAMFG